MLWGLNDIVLHPTLVNITHDQALMAYSPDTDQASRSEWRWSPIMTRIIAESPFDSILWWHTSGGILNAPCALSYSTVSIARRQPNPVHVFTRCFPRCLSARKRDAGGPVWIKEGLEWREGKMSQLQRAVPCPLVFNILPLLHTSTWHPSKL